MASTIRRRMTQVEADVSEDVLNSLGHRPGFRLILRHGPLLDLDALLATLESLRTQVYRDWRLEILASNSDTGSRDPRADFRSGPGPVRADRRGRCVRRGGTRSADRQR